jgi:hypothetical protein
MSYEKDGFEELMERAKTRKQIKAIIKARDEAEREALKYEFREDEN